MTNDLKQTTNTKRAWLEISMSKLKHNVEELTRIMPVGCELMAVVKANAYGHGDIEIATELEKQGVQAFGVATLKEAMILRNTGIAGEILIMGYTDPSESDNIAQHNLIQTIVDYEHAKSFSEQSNSIRCHIKIDTGMNRLGVNYNHIDQIEKMFTLPNLLIEGMFTHLSVADNLTQEDEAFTKQQINSFYELVEELRKAGKKVQKLHIQSSYGLLNYPTLSCDYVRIGIALYGLYSGSNDTVKTDPKLEPILALKAKVATVKEVEASASIGYGRTFKVSRPMKIATITVGYADGIPRNLDGQVLARGKKVSIIGRICMDQLMIDVTDVPDINQGDVVTLIGSEGNETIKAEEVASQSGTITNELVSRLGSRLDRIFV